MAKDALDIVDGAVGLGSSALQLRKRPSEPELARVRPHLAITSDLINLVYQRSKFADCALDFSELVHVDNSSLLDRRGNRRAGDECDGGKAGSHSN